MVVIKSDFDSVVRAFSAKPNYAGPDKELESQTGGNEEAHYILQRGRRICIASANHAQNLYTLADDIVSRLLPKHSH